MNQHHYKNTVAARRAWLFMAVFLLVVNSTPVKKFIRICITGQYSLVEFGHASQMSMPCTKDCTIIERHTDMPSFASIVADQANGEPDVSFILPLLMSAAGVFLFFPTYRQRHAREYGRQLAMPVPLLLHQCRLQV